MHRTVTPIRIEPPFVSHCHLIRTLFGLPEWLNREFLITVLTVAILSCGVSASAEDGASEFLSNPSLDPPPDGKVRTEQVDRAEQPERPELPEALLPQITQGEQLIDDVIAQNKLLNAKQEQLLLRAAEELSQVRTQSQGEQWWETLDARHRLTDLRKWLTLTPSQRAEVAESGELSLHVWTLNREGKYKEALVPAEKKLDIDRRVWGETHRNFALSLNNLAELYRAQQAYAQAEPLLKRALAIREQVLGPTHPDTATSLNNLAILYEAQGAYAQALPLYERALMIVEQGLGSTHPDTAMSLSNLAALYRKQRTYAQAEPLLKRALAIREQALGPTHPYTATSLNDLAMLYEAQGAYARALPLYERARAISEQALGPNHPDTATSLNNLAMLYHKQGQFVQAEPLLKRALAIKEQALGQNHSDTATILNNLASLYRAQGAYAQAEPLLNRARAIREQTLGPTDPDTAASLNNLGALHYRQGQYAQAEPLLKQALAIREQALGPNHPDTATSLNDLATLYAAQGADAQALPLYERALAINERALGQNHPGTARSVTNLAEQFRVQGAYTQALPLYERALAIREQALGPTHPDTARSLNNLAALYQDQGAYAQALPLYERALAIKEQTLGSTHPDTARSLNNLAALYQDQGAYAQALPLYERALAIREQALGPAHPDTTLSLENLGVLRAISEPDVQAAKWLHQSAQTRWQFLTKNFTTLTRRQQQQLLTKSRLGESGGYLWHLLTKIPDVDRASAYQVALWNKQLLVEVTRQGSSAVQQVWAKAPAEWQALWREREALKRTYASQALHEPQNTRTLTQEEARPSFSSTRDLAIQIEDLEQRLRRENPAYAQEAKLQEITVEQVQQTLKPDQALLEYVQFHPYDETTKQLAKTMHYGVYVVRGPQTPVVAVDLGDSPPIDTAIRQFQKEMQRTEGYAKAKVDRSQKQVRTAEAELAQLSSTLRRLVWQPVETALTTVTRVYVAPDGQLSEFPFEALAQKTTSRAWQYLVEERELVYLNTGRDLARLALMLETDPALYAATRTAVLIGNPKFDARPKDIAQVVAGLPTTAPLRATSNSVGAGGTLGAATGQDRLRIPRDWIQHRELDTLLAHAKQQLHRAGWTVTTWRDQQAVESVVLQLQAPRILQFATHGYLLESATSAKTWSWENPLLRSMLLLSGVNHATSEQMVFYRVGKDLLTEAEAEQQQVSLDVRQRARIYIGDGILTAYEVSGMNLHGTELVNLTACKTGLGEVTPEGVVGLRQAFFFAGARALTTSLWEVPVTETTHQMDAFYRRWLGRGTSYEKARYAAFRQTQLTALAQARKTYGAGHPFFWAGFIYLGDPGDLPVTLAHDLSAVAVPNRK